LNVLKALNTPQKLNLEDFAVLRSSKTSNDLQRDLKQSHSDKENCRFTIPLDQSAESPLPYPQQTFTGTPRMAYPNPTQKNVTEKLRGPNPALQSPYNHNSSPCAYDISETINKCLKAHQSNSTNTREIQTLREKNLQLVNKIEMVDSERKNSMRTSSNTKDFRNKKKLCMGQSDVSGIEDLTALDLGYDSVLNLYKADTPSARGEFGGFCGGGSKNSVLSERPPVLMCAFGEVI
jgi:hypothetical protein